QGQGSRRVRDPRSPRRREIHRRVGGDRGQVESQKGAGMGAAPADTAVDQDGDEHEKGDRHMSTDIRAAQMAVENFMRAAGQLDDGLSGDQRRERRMLLISEELGELEDALWDGDKVQMADAVADLIYTTLGAAVEEGIDAEVAFEEASASNDTKIDWENNRPWATHPNGKVAKDHHFVVPNMSRALVESGAPHRRPFSCVS